MKFGILVAVLLLTGLCQASTLHVCPSGCRYSSIQDAIDAANPGDSIEVQSGFYNEQITINKNITLKGINTGKGLPHIYVIYLCNHLDSVIRDIIPVILVGSCPNEGISLNNNTIIITNNETVVNHVQPAPIKPNEDNYLQFVKWAGALISVFIATLVFLRQRGKQNG
jgi:hypothetical protein